jgi:hypothetical protein
MWVSFWVVAAGWGMGRHAGQVTGPLRPPEQITAEELRWDTKDPQEVAKMKQWVKVGGWSLIIWWAIIGGLIMTYLYSVAGYAYLHEIPASGWKASRCRCRWPPSRKACSARWPGG